MKGVAEIWMFQEQVSLYLSLGKKKKSWWLQSSGLGGLEKGFY